MKSISMSLDHLEAPDNSITLLFNIYPTGKAGEIAKITNGAILKQKANENLFLSFKANFQLNDDQTIGCVSKDLLEEYGVDGIDCTCSLPVNMRADDILEEESGMLLFRSLAIKGEMNIRSIDGVPVIKEFNSKRYLAASFIIKDMQLRERPFKLEISAQSIMQDIVKPYETPSLTHMKQMLTIARSNVNKNKDQTIALNTESLNQTNPAIRGYTLSKEARDAAAKIIA